MRHVVFPRTPKHGTPENQNIPEHSENTQTPEHPPLNKQEHHIKPGTPPTKPGKVQYNCSTYCQFLL